MQEADSTFLKEGEHLFRTDDLAGNLFVVKTGKLLCYVKNKNRKIVNLMLVGAGETVGEEFIFGDESYCLYNCIALESTTVLPISKIDVYSFLSSNNTWISDILENISEKIKQGYDMSLKHSILNEELLKKEFFDEDAYHKFISSFLS